MNISEYCKYDGLGLAELVNRKEVTPQELQATALKALEKVNPQLNLISQILEKESTEEINNGLPDSPFKGVPFLIKELALHAANIPVNMGSRFAQGFTMPHDSELMARFRKAGLVTIGTTPVPEMAVVFATQSELHGITRNPWNPEHIPGGSSGAAAAAVASGVVPIAHGNDGAGSLRVPSSSNGIFGLKPTRGRVPTGPDKGDGVGGIGHEFAVSRTVRDSAVLMDLVAGPDAGPYGFAERPKRAYTEEINTSPGKLRIAWTATPISDTIVDPENVNALHEAVKLCEDLGHEMVEATPQFNTELYWKAKVRVSTGMVTGIIEDLSKAMSRQPSKNNLENYIWEIYQYGKELMATELVEALDTLGSVSN